METPSSKEGLPLCFFPFGLWHLTKFEKECTSSWSLGTPDCSKILQNLGNWNCHAVTICALKAPFLCLYTSLTRTCFPSFPTQTPDPTNQSAFLRAMKKQEMGMMITAVAHKNQTHFSLLYPWMNWPSTSKGNHGHPTPFCTLETREDCCLPWGREAGWGSSACGQHSWSQSVPQSTRPGRKARARWSHRNWWWCLPQHISFKRSRGNCLH